MGAAEEQTDSPKVRTRWAIVTFSSLIDAVSSVDAKKDPANKRPTSIWTLAGMAAISALFIYMAQTSVITPMKSTSTDASSIPLDDSTDALNSRSVTVIQVTEQAFMNGRKMGDPQSRPTLQESNIPPQRKSSKGQHAEQSSSQSQPVVLSGASTTEPGNKPEPAEETSSTEAEKKGDESKAQESSDETPGDKGAETSEEQQTTSESTLAKASGESSDSQPSQDSEPEADQQVKSQADEPSQPEDQNQGAEHKQSQDQGKNDVEKKRPTAHVFISTDEKDLRPIFVVINSTLANAKNPENVDFNLVMPQENEAAAREKLLPLFPGVKIEINRGKIDAERIERMITYKEGTGARRELVSVFNFIPFYLPFISKDLDRIVYLDADVVVVGDIGELAEVDMDGKAAAAVEDCMQMFRTYFDFKQLAQIQASKDQSKPWMPHFAYDKKTCVFNRGVLLIDVQRWIKENMTETIEWWMKKFQESKEPLYKFGLSQPPFLLALYQRYKKLDRCWNTRGLGRDAFGEKERDFLARIGFGRPPKKPFLSPWADSAKIMHFNGKYKPWRLPRTRPEGEKPKALCGEGMTDCAEHWWRYMNIETHRKLTPAEEAPAKVEA